MQPAKSEIRPATSLSGMLADIADELSVIEDWRARVLNVLCLITDHFPSADVSVGLQMTEWEVISCADTQDLGGIERSLLRAYSKLVTPPRTFPEAGQTPEKEPETGTCLTIPVIGAGDIIGVLSVYTRAEHAFTSDDVGAMAAVGLMIGSFANRVLVTEEEAAARERRDVVTARLTEHIQLLQQSLVPPKPEIAQGYRIASVYIPGGEGSEIGGDFYDLFDTKDGKIGLIIGDVAGKGITSVTLAVAARSTIHAYAYDSIQPAESLALANHLLYGLDPSTAKFVTVFLAILDPPSGRLTYACAGHPPSIIRRGDTGRTEVLKGVDLPVGIIPDEEYTQQEVQLNPGDKIIFYTDGISEARHGVELFEVEGVERVLRERGHLPPDELLHAVLSEAKAWSHDHLTDDIALIVLERNPASPDGEY